MIYFGICPYCSKEIKNMSSEFSFPPDLPALEKGNLVRMINEQHSWFNEIGIIRDKKPGFYRIEIHGSKVWFPEHWWVKIDE